MTIMSLAPYNVMATTYNHKKKMLIYLITNYSSWKKRTFYSAIVIIPLPIVIYWMNLVNRDKLYYGIVKLDKT